MTKVKETSITCPFVVAFMKKSKCINHLYIISTVHWDMAHYNIDAESFQIEFAVYI